MFFNSLISVLVASKEAFAVPSASYHWSRVNQPKQMVIEEIFFVSFFSIHCVNNDTYIPFWIVCVWFFLNMFHLLSCISLFLIKSLLLIPWFCYLDQKCWWKMLKSFQWVQHFEEWKQSISFPSITQVRCVLLQVLRPFSISYFEPQDFPVQSRSITLV